MGPHSHISELWTSLSSILLICQELQMWSTSPINFLQHAVGLQQQQCTPVV